MPEPNSVIRFYKDIPLDEKYNHTLYFGNVVAQTSYFSSHIYKQFGNLSYQRVNANSFKIEEPADNLYNCNYIAFQNTNYGNKWFYAFIQEVNYINDVTTEIVYLIDVMQTYFFDVTLLPSFIDREHSATDVVGDNIVPENIDVGEYFDGPMIQTNLFNNYTLACIAPINWEASPTPIFDEWTTTKITNNFCAMNNWYYSETDETLILAFLQEDLQRIASARDASVEDVYAIYLIPMPFVDCTKGDKEHLPSNSVYKDITFTDHKPTLVGGYEPRNKKLLTYPYTFFTVTTMDTTNTYKYEYFNTQNITFRIFANLTSNSSYRCSPTFYKGESLNVEEGLILDNFPMLPWASRTFADWLSRNRTKIAINGISDVANNIASSGGYGKVKAGSQMLTPKTGVISAKGAKMMSKGYNEMFSSAINCGETLANIMGNISSQVGVPNELHGSTDGSLEIAMGYKDFIYKQKYINPIMAEIIDDYFDMYGYSTKEIKVPNRNVRPHWTYTKTIGCVIRGNAPSSVLKDIATIYDNGITFWRNASEVGNYSLNNSI